ncbi:hypothetical protein EV646_111271 [Kribbella antiqua]|uniref:Uncharacterized protein n=1 Tax=Kribbella antiqua TaxID=2512217 RepID=A0A4R2IJT8_9ACTN|nr:hypothetical protein EV646_111271 [Kribbella antiqua]
MDQESLDRACRDLQARRESLGDAGSEMARLRSDGYSVVESMYIIANVFEISLSEAKRLAVTDGSGNLDTYIDDFHNDVEDGFRR